MKLISFLGLGEAKRDSNSKPTGEYFYHKTTYRFNQDPQTDISNTCYVVRAITQGYTINEKTTGLQRVDEVVLLATEQAEKAHIDKILAEFEVYQLPRPHVVRVPFGANAEQQWEQFHTILENIPQGNDKKVIFDITHGFRSQPFFAAAVINYVRSTRNVENIPDMRILYGEYNSAKQVSDIWDMSTFINLLDWSSALQSFIKTGHGAALAQLAKRENATIQKTGQGERPRMLAKLAESIKAFSDNIATVRVLQIITESAKGRGSAANVLQTITDSEAEIRQHFMPLYPVLEQLKEKLKDIPAQSLFSSQGHVSMLTLAKLYIDYERYPEAAIVVREGWVSLYANTNLTDKELLDKKGRDKTEKCWYEKEGEENNPQGYADLIGLIRNDIQHGGFRSSPSPADKLIQNLQDLVGKFESKIQDYETTNCLEIPPTKSSKTYFISRHPGAALWAESEGFHIDQLLAHFDVGIVQSGDTVLGTLPINLVAEMNARGGRYFHLTLELPAEARGQELSADDMRRYGARLECFTAQKQV
ncbi:CRISPR-associated protein Csx16 [Thiofilum flexile]|uniref:CRISPR-associated protein Csx16 n=1 Tax=Thiofilum flexile TaxID=125627 RepID=UPI000368384D|nr:CRISPR-associated protein Csx16 [Thiofilum flexile]